MNLPQGYTPAALGYFLATTHQVQDTSQREALDWLCLYAGEYLVKVNNATPLTAVGLGSVGDPGGRRARREQTRELRSYLKRRTYERRKQQIAAGEVRGGLISSLIFTAVIHTLVGIVVRSVIDMLFSNEGSRYLTRYTAALSA